MKSHYLTSKIGGAFLTLAMLFGIGFATSVTTQAQWGRNQDQIRRQREYEREQRRREREIQREQARRAREQRRNGDYRNDGYYGNDGYGNNGYGYGNDNLRQTALNAGFNNGIEEGRKDRRNGDRYDFRDERDYQNATIDYSSKLGDRELYRRYFRQGFENGYRSGYNGY